jgi:hypothetical protein
MSWTGHPQDSPAYFFYNKLPKDHLIKVFHETLSLRGNKSPKDLLGSNGKSKEGPSSEARVGITVYAKVGANQHTL